MHRIKTAAVLVGACGTFLAVMAGAASAKTITLHFFSKQVYSSFTGPSGQALPQNAPPTLGDRFAFASDDYAGNHKHHARRPSSSTHVDCVVNSASTAVCDASLALPSGAMLFADSWTLNLATGGPPAVVHLTGGTNQYRHARGTVQVKNVGGPNSNFSDNTVRFTP
jgi:hypothetical protein